MNISLKAPKGQQSKDLHSKSESNVFQRRVSNERKGVMENNEDIHALFNYGPGTQLIWLYSMGDGLVEKGH